MYCRLFSSYTTQTDSLFGKTIPPGIVFSFTSVMCFDRFIRVFVLIFWGSVFFPLINYYYYISDRQDCMAVCVRACGVFWGPSVSWQRTGLFLGRTQIGMFANTQLSTVRLSTPFSYKNATISREKRIVFFV